MKKLMALIVFFASTPVFAQEQPSPQALMQAAFRQAQRCIEQSVIDEARLRTEMQAQIDVLKKQLETMQKTQNEQKKDQP